MKKILALVIALAFLAGINGVALAADTTTDNSTISADKTPKQDAPAKTETKKTKTKTSKKSKSKKKTTSTKTKTKKKKKSGTAASKPAADNS